VRDGILLDYLRRLPNAAAAAAQDVGETAEQLAAQKRREAALQERRRQVDHDKMISQRSLEFGRNELTAMEAELRQATSASKKGLLGALSHKTDPLQQPIDLIEARGNIE